MSLLIKRKTSEEGAALAPTRVKPRWALHLPLLVAFAAASGALLVWPQWINVDGAREALRLQAEREQESQDRWDAVRSMSDRLHDWQREQRRIFLKEEAAIYPRFVQSVGLKCGASANAIVTTKVSPRWRTTSLRATAPMLESETGEIQPRQVKVSVRGTFDSVYRTVATLSQQQQLFVPERWDLSPEPGTAMVTAEVWGAVFVLADPEQKQPEPVPASPNHPVAEARLVETRG